MKLSTHPGWALGYRRLEQTPRRHLALATGAGLTSAILEAVSLATLGYAATREHEATAAAALAVAIALAIVATAAAKALSEARFARAQITLETALRREMTDAVLAADWQAFVDQPGHELQSAAISEAPQVAQAATAYSRGRAALLTTGVLFLSTLAVSPAASLICAAFGALIAVVFNHASRGLAPVQAALAASNVRLTQQTSILVHGLRTLRLSPARGPWRSRLEADFLAHADARSRDLLVPVRARLLVEALAGLMILCVLLAQVGLTGELLPGLIVMALILRILPRAQQAQHHLTFARHGATWVNRWDERLALLQHPPQGQDLIAVSAPLSAPDGAALELRNVSLSYRRHSRPVLAGVDLRLERGRWVALTGVSGGGKSTLIDVIGGLLQPDHGEVLLRGVPIDVVADLHEHLVVVPQDVHLLGDEPAEILRWDGLLPQSPQAAAISSALGVDQMFHFSDGEVRVDELGRDISGGMRTRLAMARALITDPCVLVLDETTARLHPEAEAEIFGAVRRLRPDLAVLVVTHRQETIALADEHLVLQDGHLCSGLDARA